VQRWSLQVLSVKNLKSGYGRIEALHGVSLDVAAREIVTLVGANGAGKTTLLRAISGVQPILSGRIYFDGRSIEHAPPHARVTLGIAQVPEGRQLFAPLSVEDNLKLGAWTRRAIEPGTGLDRVYDLFPMLAELRHTLAGALSGGQQQVLAIGRALTANPRLLLLDEPSMGLAPILVDQILNVILDLRREGLTVLLVEQNAMAALGIADRGYVMETGTISASGVAADIKNDSRIRQAYLGI
jgi:branched-chain amino acid transport system ATP-binding protein